jgi:hypothetical protein
VQVASKILVCMHTITHHSQLSQNCSTNIISFSTKRGLITPGFNILKIWQIRINKQGTQVLIMKENVMSWLLGPILCRYIFYLDIPVG